MNYPILLENVDFTYPLAEDDGEEEAREAAKPLFSGLSLGLPRGFTFMVGPNGIGKSTLMLLASARLFPGAGRITILERPSTDFLDAAVDPDLEEERNRRVSFVYQNMEFETEFPLGDVLELVAANSVDPAGAARRYADLLDAADLRERLGARMQELSKGEMQRAIVVMSVLYGSPILMMDEPVFAVEAHRAEQLFAYLRELCRDGSHTMYASVHDVELARKFGDSVVLMHSDGAVEAGPAEELLTRESLETAFRAPWDTLYRRQALYREFLNKTALTED
ncbi:MAG: ABC transporter ATP-binding protein [Spirochaetaceae bacterium]|nr:MAG: ABC transporter ATP-binding protein [Spirochaetaceae bacterium]